MPAVGTRYSYIRLVVNGIGECREDLQNIAELVTWDMTTEHVATINGTVDVDFSDWQYYQDWVDLMGAVKRIKTRYETTENDVTAEYRLKAKGV